MSQKPSAAKSRSSRPELTAKPVNKRPIIIAVIALLILIALFGGVGTLLFLNPDATTVLRDMSIILLTFVALVIAFIAMLLVVTLVYLTLKVNDLVQLINREVQPLLQKLNDTAATASDTAKTVQRRVVVVSDEAVKPVVGLLSSISAAKSVLKTLFKRK